ncbi:MAG: hypothetical protein Q9192_005126 [Flavoplaca navasiana]
MDNASDHGSETSERTVLSDSVEEKTDLVAHRSSVLPGPKNKSGQSVSTTTLLANIWQFLLGRNFLDLKRFYIYNFLPAETVTNIAEGTSYRVSKTSEKNVNVAQLIDYGAEETQGHLAIYLVADFASGGTLKDYLIEHDDVSMLDRAHFCYDISSGLAGLHACGIVQGDLKLANVLVFADKGEFVVKLSDFGCSIFDGDSAYTGSWIYNASEIRRGRFGGFGPKIDIYASDIFSLGLVVWETLQGVRPFIEPSLELNQLSWLNGLPRDDLLLQALKSFEMLPIQGSFPKRVIRGVLEGSLPDDPKSRNTSSYIIASKIPPLQKWSFTRTDNLASTVPVSLQTELLTQIKGDVGGSAETTIESACFHLAMCHLTGFGTPVSQDKFLESLIRGAASGEAYSSGLHLRMHRALQAPTDGMLLTKHPIAQVEENLQKISQRNFITPIAFASTKKRFKEGCFMRHLIFRQALFKTKALHGTIGQGKGTDVDNQLDIDGDTLNAIKTVLQDTASDKRPLLAISHALANEGLHHLLHVAARLGLKDIIEMTLEAGVDANTEDQDGATPLIAACRGGHADIVSLLMDRGADPWNRQRGGLSSFHWLMMFEDSEVSWVLEKIRSTHNSMVMESVMAEPLDLLEHGLRLRWSPVHFAVEVRNMTVTKALLDAGTSIRAGNTTPLNIAVANHCPEMTKLLLAHGMPNWQRTPFLHIGEVSTFKLLLLHGDQRRRNLYDTAREVLESCYGNINQNDRDGYRPLAKTMRRFPWDLDMTVLDCLINHGAKLDNNKTITVYCLTAREDGRAGRIGSAININTALLVRAVMHRNRETLDAILATGIDVNTRTDENLSPLIAAILFAKRAYAVQALLDHGADVDAIVEIDSDKKSVLELCMALPEGDGQMLDALIDGGTSLVRKDGSNIVFQACTVPAKINGAHVLRHLLETNPRLRAFVNVECNNYTPIHAACFIGSLEAVTILLEYGGEVDTTLAFNPITTTEHLARSPEDRYVPFERDGFKLERWKMTAEAVLMKLLDKSDPGHGRNQLHIATSICNYDRVVELVEGGMQPWRGDSKKVTPLGLLPKEVFEYDDTQDSDPQKDFIVQGLKIKEYLEHRMVEWASQLETHLKGVYDQTQTESGEKHPKTLAAMAELAEIYMMQERWAEAEDLLSLIIQRRQKPKDEESNEIDEIRSSLIATLIALNKLEEARELVDKSLAGAIPKALCCEEPLEISSHDIVASDPNVPDATPSIEEEEEGIVPLFPTLAAIEDTVALDQFIKVWKCDESFKGTKLMTYALETIRTSERCSKPLYIRLAGELICRYCGLDRWEESEKELQFFLGTLDVFEAERFPPTYNMLLRVAEVLKSYSKWTKAEEIYRKRYSYTLGSRSRTSYYSTNTLRLTVNLFELQLNYKEAAKSQFQLLEACQQIFGLESVESQWQKLELARIYEKDGRLVECVILQRQALQVFKSFGQDERQNALTAKTRLCRALAKKQVLDEAESLAHEIVAECNDLHGSSGSETLTAMNDLALVLNNQERCEEAIVLYKEIQADTFGEVHESTRHAMTELLPTYIRANMLDEAETLGKRLVSVSETL